MGKLIERKDHSYVYTLRRFFQYGNQEFSDFVMSVFNGNLKELLDMSNRYCRIACTNDYLKAQRFTSGFVDKLDDAQREQPYCFHIIEQHPVKGEAVLPVDVKPDTITQSKCRPEAVGSSLLHQDKHQHESHEQCASFL